MPERIQKGAVINANDYLSAPEIAKDAGVANATVHTWLKYFGYMETARIMGRPAVHKEEYARFKEKHPELIKTASPSEAPQ